MGKPTGFLEYTRRDAPKRAVSERIRDYREIEQALSPEELQQQAARCMDCGLPFCHTFGCPLANVVPEWNDMVYRGRWQDALELLHATNNLPEITGRICPALCEAACTLDADGDGVSIRQIELAIAERGWQEGWIQARPAAHKTGKRVAVVGSGPAGLAAAQQLVRRGHDVVVFERDDAMGGILRYGIPDFKLEKWVIDRRLDQMKGEGVTFEGGVDVGRDISARYLQRSFNAILLTAGCRVPRDISVPGRDLQGVHFAMDYLAAQNRKNAGLLANVPEDGNADGKRVVVIGGGDTGADCVGTAHRQGAASICQIELLPRPALVRADNDPWPTWPRILRSGSSHEEGCERQWSVLSKEFIGSGGRVKAVRCVRLEWGGAGPGRLPSFREVAGSEFELVADIVLLAMGFVHVAHGPIVEDLQLGLDERQNLEVTAERMTTSPGVFAAGDCVSGASLAVRAIDGGRRAACAVDRYLRRPCPLPR